MNKGQPVAIVTNQKHAERREMVVALRGVGRCAHSVTRTCSVCASRSADVNRYVPDLFTTYAALSHSP